MKRSLSTMSYAELEAEELKMREAITRLNGTQDQTGLVQLQAAKALKFALECEMRNRWSAPTPNTTNVVSLSDYKARRDQKRGLQVS